MDLLQRLVGWVSGPQHKQLINHVASTSLESVWRKIAHRVVGMRPPVARGYIRARAISVVAHTCQTLSWQYPQVRAAGDRIRAAALELVVKELEQRAMRLGASQPRNSQAERRAA